MAELIRDLGGITNVLRAAHIDAVCDRWHLDERALPSLRAMAHESEGHRLQQAADATAAAAKHFVAAKEALRDAIRITDDSGDTAPATDEMP